MDNEDPIAAGEEPVRADEAAFESEHLEAPEEDLFEIELDGAVHRAPAALKGAFLRQADYTRKTQELAEQRRALEAERQAHADERGERLRLAALDHQLEDFQGVDWQAFAADDPQGARVAWDGYQRLGQARERLAEAVAHHDERAQLAAAREAAEAMAAVGGTLSQEIEGWSPDVAAKLVEYGRAFGVTLEEFAQMADPRLWKLLHKAWKADEASHGEARAQAQAVRPAVQVSGAGAGGGGVRDELSTKEWMRRRNAQVAGER